MRFSRMLALVGALALVGCGIPEEKYNSDMAKLKAEIDDARGENADLKERLSTLREERRSLEAEIKMLQQQIDQLSADKEANAKLIEQARQRLEMFKNMLAKFKKMIESGKIKIKIVNNKMLVEMASAILFPSAKAKLSEEGEAALTEVGGILATISDREFQVARHTDNIPIKNRRFKSNWDLSTSRAVAVVRHLIDSGMDPDSLSAAGYAATQPVASNETAQGRAQNRRIEIVLQPNLDELPDLSSLEGMVD